MGYAPNPSQESTGPIYQEANEVAAYFHVVPSNLADSNTLRNNASSARLIHISCHGHFDLQDPLASGILLTDKEFTARDWLQLRLQADLVTLSACESGIIASDQGDDVVGLMRAILFAGASSLLMTLGSVNAEKTRDWMQRFYHSAWNEGGQQIVDKAAAFRKATLELQQSHPDPYFWAPFILVGNYQ
jgi:CHAT domain-containing protein